MSHDPLGLRELPSSPPPDSLWSALEQSLDQAPGQTARARSGWKAPIALAALLLLAVGALIQQQALLPDPAAQSQTSALATNVQSTGVEGNDSRGNTLDRLQRVSATLEEQLQNWQGGVVNAQTADVIARLEQELLWLDVELQQTPEDTTLWAERVALLGELNQRYASSDWRAGMMLATY